MLQEGRGIGLANKVAAYGLQDGGLDTVDANRHLGFDDDLRSYEAVKYILGDMGIKVRAALEVESARIECDGIERCFQVHVRSRFFSNTAVS